MRNRVVITVSLTPELEAQLNECWRAAGWTRSAVMRAALERYFAQPFVHLEPQAVAKLTPMPPKSRGTRLPEDFTLTPDLEAFCRKQGCRNPKALFESFKDYWRSQAGQKGVKLDWNATLRTWARRHLHCPCEKPGQATDRRGQPPIVTAKSLEEKWQREG